MQLSQWEAKDASKAAGVEGCLIDRYRMMGREELEKLVDKAGEGTQIVTRRLIGPVADAADLP